MVKLPNVKGFGTTTGISLGVSEHLKNEKLAAKEAEKRKAELTKTLLSLSPETLAELPENTIEGLVGSSKKTPSSGPDAFVAMLDRRFRGE